MGIGNWLVHVFPLGKELSLNARQLKDRCANLSIFRVLIHACGKSGNYVKAFDLFADYKSRHYRHNFGILADLFNACANAAESERGAALARANQVW